MALAGGSCCGGGRLRLWCAIVLAMSKRDDKPIDLFVGGQLVRGVTVCPECEGRVRFRMLRQVEEDRRLARRDWEEYLEDSKGVMSKRVYRAFKGVRSAEPLALDTAVPVDKEGRVRDFELVVGARGVLCRRYVVGADLSMVAADEAWRESLESEFESDEDGLRVDMSGLKRRRDG